MKISRSILILIALFPVALIGQESDTLPNWIKGEDLINNYGAIIMSPDYPSPFIWDNCTRSRYNYVMPIYDSVYPFPITIRLGDTIRLWRYDTIKGEGIYMGINKADTTNNPPEDE